MNKKQLVSIIEGRLSDILEDTDAAHDLAFKLIDSHVMKEVRKLFPKGVELARCKVCGRPIYSEKYAALEVGPKCWKRVINGQVVARKDPPVVKPEVTFNSSQLTLTLL